jgi:hypothetical protein
MDERIKDAMASCYTDDPLYYSSVENLQKSVED